MVSNKLSQQSGVTMGAISKKKITIFFRSKIKPKISVGNIQLLNQHPIEQQFSSGLGT